MLSWFCIQTTSLLATACWVTLWFKTEEKGTFVFCCHTRQVRGGDSSVLPLTMSSFWFQKFSSVYGWLSYYGNILRTDRWVSDLVRPLVEINTFIPNQEMLRMFPWQPLRNTSMWLYHSSSVIVGIWHLLRVKGHHHWHWLLNEPAAEDAATSSINETLKLSTHFSAFVGTVSPTLHLPHLNQSEAVDLNQMYEQGDIENMHWSRFDTCTFQHFGT